MRMTFRVIVIGGVIVFFAVVAVVVFIPSLVWNPPQTTIAHLYTPEQERGRELFYSNGCNYCHTQYVRAEDTAMGPESQGGELCLRRSCDPGLRTYRAGSFLPWTEAQRSVGDRSS